MRWHSLKSACLAALLLGGCGGAQLKAEAHASASLDNSDDRKSETAEKPAEAPASAAKPALAAAPPPIAPRSDFVGALHDLALAPGAAATPACTCLAVAYGSPTDPKFAWQAGPRESSADTIAVAISGDVECRVPHDAAPPSIAGVLRRGDDVVVLVEAARGGRPVVRGAIAPRPGPKGSLVIQGRGHVPYGTPLAGGSGSCRIPVTSG